MTISQTRNVALSLALSRAIPRSVSICCRGPALPLVSRCHPHVRDMAEQVGLALLFGPEPPCHRLRCRVFEVDAMDDAIELEGRERPIDRRPRGFDRVTLAAKIIGDIPADFEARPPRRKPRPDPACEFSACPFLDHKHADAMQHPVPGHGGRVPPPDQL